MAICAVGCRASFVDPTVPEGGSEHSAWTHHFLFGSIASSHVDVRDVCVSGRARRVETGGDALTVLVGVASLGIYTPREVRITCGPDRQSK